MRPFAATQPGEQMTVVAGSHCKDGSLEIGRMLDEVFLDHNHVAVIGLNDRLTLAQGCRGRHLHWGTDRLWSHNCRERLL